MLNRSYTRARNGKLKGHQLELPLPRRGRPSKHRALERCGQLRLDLDQRPPIRPNYMSSPHVAIEQNLGDALQMCIRPMTEDELEAEFNRLFPLDGPV